MNTKKQAEKIIEKIKSLTTGNVTHPVLASFEITDDSVQAELRLRAHWEVWKQVDHINYPKDLSDQAGDLWGQMSVKKYEIDKIRRMVKRNYPESERGWENTIIKINAKNKNGEEKRSEAKAAWIVEAGKQFLIDYKRVTSKKHLASIRNQIINLQSQQKALLPALRKSNSEFCAARKNAKTEQGKKNAAALISGRFWEADETAIKGYFHPPFNKNYLADVSEKWRAALFLECESISYKSYNGDWRHKLGGTGRGYLCGIDDNGDEWGFVVRDLPQSSDNYGNSTLDNTVEEAMSNVFGISTNNLQKCTRQGDLLFCPVEIRKTESPEHCARCGETREKHHATHETWHGWEGGEKIRDYLACYYEGNTDEYTPHIHKAPVLNPADQWEPRTAHIITSHSLKHNGVYFSAEDDIEVLHTSHHSVTLPAGEYRLYMSRMADDRD